MRNIQVRRRASGLLFAILSAGRLMATAMAAPDADDFSWVRGANFVPSYARNDVQIWMDYDPVVVDRELGYAAKLDLNCVGVFLQVAVYNNDPQQIGCAVSTDGLRWTRLFREPLIPNGQPGDWNSSETGHPGIFTDTDGRTYLFVQGNNDKGRTWFLSAYEIDWHRGRPAVVWDSAKFPIERPGPAAHSEGGIAFSPGWTCWRGEGPRGGGLHYANTAGATATWETTGGDVTLIHKVGPDCGLAHVLIDGQPATQAEFDTYAPTVEWNYRRVLATNHPPRRHLVTVLTLGQKNEKSSDRYVQIVGFE